MSAKRLSAPVKKLLWSAAVLLLSFLLVLHFLESFPNGWDQAEYAWCLKANYLPHSPYILHFFLGKVFYWMFRDAAQALSALSLVAGMGSLLLFYFVTRRCCGSVDSTAQDTAGKLKPEASRASAGDERVSTNAPRNRALKRQPRRHRTRARRHDGSRRVSTVAASPLPPTGGSRASLDADALRDACHAPLRRQLLVR